MTNPGTYQTCNTLRRSWVYSRNARLIFQWKKKKISPWNSPHESNERENPYDNHMQVIS